MLIAIAKDFWEGWLRPLNPTLAKHLPLAAAAIASCLIADGVQAPVKAQGSIECRSADGRTMTFQGATSCPFGLRAVGSAAPAQPQTLQAPPPTSAATTAPVTPRPVAPPPPTPEELERQRNVAAMHAELKAIQNVLHSQGAYAGTVDGLWGPGTEQAIRQWQARNGKPQTGVLSSADLEQFRTLNQALPTTQAPAAAAEPAKPEPQRAASADNAEAAKADLRRRYTGRIDPDTLDRVLSGGLTDLLVVAKAQGSSSEPGRRDVSKPTYCLVGGQPTPDLVQYAVDRLIEASPGAGDPQKTECKADLKSATADSVFLERGSLFEHSAAVVDPLLGIALLDALQAKTLSIQDVVSATAFNLRKERLKTEGARYLAALSEGKLTGMGMLILNNSSRVVCGAKGDDAALLRYEATRLSLSIVDPSARASNERNIEQAVLEDLYVRVKANSCRQVVGSDQTLRPLMNALRSDNVAVSLAPAWISEKDLAADAARFKQAAAKPATPPPASAATPAKPQEPPAPSTASRAPEKERDNKASPQASVSPPAAPTPSGKPSEDEEARREEALRNRPIITVKVQGIADSLVAEVHRHIASVVAEAAQEASGVKPSDAEAKAQALQREKDRLDDNYKPFNEWVASQVRGHFQFGEIAPSIEDYGTGEINGRLIDGVSINIELSTTHPQRGKISACWTFTWLNDLVRHTRLHHMIVPCRDYIGAFKDWSDANKFRSLWKT
jgi:peptidoglycan hydrolase-like protein with peptidoglycan-binding domain